MDTEAATFKAHRLPFFPSALPDEYVDSLVKRYHLLSGNAAACYTSEQLTGRKVLPGHVYADGILDYMFLHLPSGYVSSPEQLLNDHTLYPYARALGDIPRRAEGAIDKRARPNYVLPDIKIPRYVFGLQLNLWFCTMCVYEDIKAYGIAYWHRHHQLNFTNICAKHGCRLLADCPNCTTNMLANHGFDYQAMPAVKCSNGHTLNPFEAILRKDITIIERKLTNYACRLLRPNKLTPSWKQRWSFYRNAFIRKGWKRPQDNHEEIAKAISSSIGGRSWDMTLRYVIDKKELGIHRDCTPDDIYEDLRLIADPRKAGNGESPAELPHLCILSYVLGLRNIACRELMR